jgi:hypothetical protein
MRTLLRCGFMALIALIVALQLTRGQRGDDDSDPMATLAAGLRRLNVRIDGSIASDIVTGHAPSCEQPIHILPMRIDGVADERLRGLRQEDEVVRYAYLGLVEPERHNSVMIGRWIWASVGFIAGSRPARPRFEFVAVVLPRACPDLVALEWSELSPAE